MNNPEFKLLVSAPARIGDEWVAVYESVPPGPNPALLTKSQFIRLSDGAEWELVSFVSSRPVGGVFPSRQVALRAVVDSGLVLCDGDELVRK